MSFKDKDNIHYLRTEDAGLEELYKRLSDVIEEFGEGLTYETILGVLDVIRFELLMERQDGD